MIELKVFDNLEDAVKFCLGMGDGRLDPDIAKAMNRAMRGVRTDVNREIVSSRGIRRSELKDWKFRNAKPGDLESLAVISGRRLGLEKFSPSPSRVMEGNRNGGGVSVNIMGKQVHLRHAFMHDFRSGDLQVLQRKKGARPKTDYDDSGRRLKGRFPVYHPTAVSVPQIADDDDIVEVAVKSTGGRFLDQFDHLIERLIREYK